MDTETTTTIPPALALALLKAQREVKAALKTSENKFHGYKYASAEQVLTVGRDALNDAGLIMIPAAEDFSPLATLDDKLGGAVAIIRTRYVIVHESGTSWTFSTDVPVVPERGKSSGWSRPADKAAFGSRTEALGYALRDLLLIPREDAPDVSGRRDGARTGARPADEDKPAAPTPPKTDEQTVPRYVADLREASKGKMSDVLLVHSRGRAALAPTDWDALDAAFAHIVCARIDATNDATGLKNVDNFLARVVVGEKASATINAARAKARERIAAA